MFQQGKFFFSHTDFFSENTLFCLGSSTSLIMCIIPFFRHLLSIAHNINLINHILCINICTVFPWWVYISIQKACCRCPATRPPTPPQYCLANPLILIKRWPFSLCDSCPNKCGTLEQKGWRKFLHPSCPLPSLAKPWFPAMPAVSSDRRWSCAV